MSQEDQPLAPPFKIEKQYLLKKVKMMHTFYLGFISVLLGIGIWGAYRIDVLHERSWSKDFVAMPSVISMYSRFRLSGFSDDVIFEYADHYIEQKTNWKWSNIERKYKQLGRYETASLEVRNSVQLEQFKNYWQENRIAQEFEYSPPKKVERKKDKKSGRIHYHVSVWGTITEYINGVKQPPWRERVTIEFRAARVDSTKSWLFETVNIVRETDEEINLKEMSKKKREEIDRG